MPHELSVPRPCHQYTSLPVPPTPRSRQYVSTHIAGRVNWRYVGFITHQHNEALLAPRKSAVHYQKNIWDHEFLESLQSAFYKDENCTRRIEELKEEVREVLIDDKIRSLAKLELIDSIERLGVGYHFEKEIEKTLQILYFKESTIVVNDLHSVSLYFRILRQHGYHVSPDVFDGFKDNKGHFQAELCEDVKGLLSLYEASHLCLEGDHILDEAKSFTTKHLSFDKSNMNSNLAQEVTHALELPLHWRMPRLESRWSIEAGQRSENNMNPSLLELAKLDFNLVEATHQKELRNISSWWRHLNLAKSMSFARDRLVETFIWSVGLTYEPQHQLCREWVTKAVSLIVTIDDIYDIYGSLDELELFTAAVERWDSEAVKQLPEYMKICYLALYNTTNEMAYTASRDQQNLDILPYLRKVWEDFCKSMLLEAKWSKNGYTPSLKEYLDNAWISSSTPVVLIHAFFATKQKITDDVLECLYNNHEPICSSSLILRLCNDLATSSVELERGDVPSSIQCYMKEANTSVGIARNKIKDLVTEAWKKLNKSVNESPFEDSFVKIVLNHARASHSIYQRGDGISLQDHNGKERIEALSLSSTKKVEIDQLTYARDGVQKSLQFVYGSSTKSLRKCNMPKPRPKIK